MKDNKIVAGDLTKSRNDQKIGASLMQNKAQRGWKKFEIGVLLPPTSANSPN